MSDGIFIVLGAVIAALGSFFATWLRLTGKRDYYDKEATKFLVKKLKQHPDGVAWEEIRVHGKNIGLDDEGIKQLLLLAKAEPSETPPLRWKLK